MADFFVQNLIAVFFFYGLSFFCMGVAILLEVGHSSGLDFARALRPLAFFGIIHGSHEWFEMFLLIHGHISNSTIAGIVFPLRIFLLASSFLMLLAFGARILSRPTNPRNIIISLTLAAVIWLIGFFWIFYSSQEPVSLQAAVDVYTRYALAVPGAALTTWGLLIQRRRFIEQGMHSFGRDVALAALAFAIYGGVGQVFASPSSIFPSPYLNSESFLRWFGFPIQVLRALMACFAAIFIIRSLRAFQEETARRIASLKDAQAAERQRLEELREELLHRTVKAQETERKRIALELHDQIGQTFTALSMGLRGMAQNIEQAPKRALQQAQQLEAVASNGIQEMQRLVTGLHPPQLDDLGLVAALRWYASDLSDHSQLKIDINNQIPHLSLPSDLRVVLFRIAQEALTNVSRHAKATHIEIQLYEDNSFIIMVIQDNGIGFSVEKTLSQSREKPCWGLFGMQERSALLGGTCIITSEPGRGTWIEVHIPLKGENHNAGDPSFIGR
jgi:signal transduction histidine kinase